MEALIQFDVQHLPNGDAIISCQDNGVGMDEYIVRNYLSVAGRSFYTSKEFEKYGFKMDAISRFGIGILSCFMAADEIEISTLRDANINGNSVSLRIHVPSISQQFRVYPGEQSHLPGTKVTVKFLGKNLQFAPKGWNEYVRVADYRGHLRKRKLNDLNALQRAAVA